MSRIDPMDLVRRRARVRVRSGAIYGHGVVPPVMAEGEVIGYQSHPTIILRHEDGTQSSWSVTLPIEEMEGASADEPEFFIPGGVSRERALELGAWAAAQHRSRSVADGTLPAGSGEPIPRPETDENPTDGANDDEGQSQ